VSRWGDDQRDGDERELVRPSYLDYPRIPSRELRDHEIPQEVGERQIYRHHEKDYRLNSAEIAALRDVGRFRIVDVQDVGKFLYKGQQDVARRDVRHLQNQKLVRVIHLPGNDRIKFATLTKEGSELVRSQFAGKRGQEIYSGVKKVRELEHDAAVYRMYRKEVGRMQEHGCRPVRVRLDYEMKRDVLRDIERERRRTRRGLQDVRQAVARQHRLAILDNKIQFPDVRIEYERDCADQDCREYGNDRSASLGGGEVDLEYVTDHYKAGQIAAKRAAGFTLYTDNGHGRRALDGPDLMGSILR
jgi:hypothetical protein